MLGKMNGKVVDLTDVMTVMVHGAKNYDKAEKMLKTMSVVEVRKHFCSNCGNEKLLDIGCMCGGNGN